MREYGRSVDKRGRLVCAGRRVKRGVVRARAAVWAHGERACAWPRVRAHGRACVRMAARACAYGGPA
eukprot:6103797-Pleurochrysis_carterae.AAC.1